MAGAKCCGAHSRRPLTLEAAVEARSPPIAKYVCLSLWLLLDKLLLGEIWNYVLQSPFYPKQWGLVLTGKQKKTDPVMSCLSYDHMQRNTDHQTLRAHQIVLGVSWRMFTKEKSIINYAKNTFKILLTHLFQSLHPSYSIHCSSQKHFLPPLSIPKTLILKP